LSFSVLLSVDFVAGREHFGLPDPEPQRRKGRRGNAEFKRARRLPSSSFLRQHGDPFRLGRRGRLRSRLAHGARAPSPASRREGASSCSRSSIANGEPPGSAGVSPALGGWLVGICFPTSALCRQSNPFRLGRRGRLRSSGRDVGFTTKSNCWRCLPFRLGGRDARAPRGRFDDDLDFASSPIPFAWAGGGACAPGAKRRGFHKAN
jgi:hypothetical protein